MFRCADILQNLLRYGMAGNGDDSNDGVERRSWQGDKKEGGDGGSGVNVDIYPATATASGAAKEGDEAADAGAKEGAAEKEGAGEKKKEENVDMGNYIVCFTFSTKRIQFEN